MEKLETVGRAPSRSPEVLELNRTFLGGGRRQLYEQVRSKTAALSKYLNDLKGTFTAEEVQAVERSIRELEQEAASLSALMETDGRSRRVDTTTGPPAPSPTASNALIQNASYVGASAESHPSGLPGGGSGETAPSSDGATPHRAVNEAASSTLLPNPPPPPLADCSEFKAN